MRLTWVHAKAATLELLRYPSFSIPTLVFPAALFLVVGKPRAGEAAVTPMASFAGLAILGVAFFQFGVGIAAERASPWHAFLRILPAPARVRVAARVISALAFAFAAALGVVVLALVTTGARLGAGEWVLLLVTLLTGSVPFAFLGIALGYWLTPKGALPLANLLFLGLSYAGGLWTDPAELPGPIAAISPYLPTRLWGELLAGSVEEGAVKVTTAAWLGAYGAAFALLASWGYHRDEGERFR